jgi:hypothetical protein
MTPLEERLYAALWRIAKDAQSPEQVKRSAHLFGLEPDEALEMAYDNIKSIAKSAIKGIRKPKK